MLVTREEVVIIRLISFSKGPVKRMDLDKQGPIICAIHKADDVWEP